ncbi:hypothetical protein QYE76_064790 [Lolium multiflorum]|uniref:HTH OST-type domain-containing protein n=1 Tax=Lolium multiflorum TaxID=4521 RepID=A0AAD8W9F2_LOLMU|nr:hypothetical protein QYE76_064790 [Lolium multiflorum]
MSQALARRGYPFLLVRVQAVRSLSSHAAGGGASYGGGERWRGHPQQQEESKAVKVSVWWDFQMCQLPPGANPCRVAPRITAALRAAGIRGPVEITAFGDVFTLRRRVQEVLAATGVAFSHVPPSGKPGSDRSLMADLVYWIAQNPPPAHFFLISGDKHFANILHRLRMSNYNVLLACPNTEPSVMCSAATIMWPWDALIEGVGFSRKHFNHPPDGLSGSWYGHYRGALDDPFLNAEPEQSMNVPLHTKEPEKPPTVPGYVANMIRIVLNYYPEGVNLEDLLSELKRKGVVDNRLLGFKNFSDLLQSIPCYVKFIDPLPGDSRPAVVNGKNFKRISSAQSSGNGKCFIEMKNGKSPLSNAPSSPFDTFSRDQRKSPPIDFIKPAESPAWHMEADTVIAAGTPSSGLQGTISKKGLFERIQILWNGPKPTKPQVYPCNDATFSKGFNDATTPDGKGLANNSAVSTSLSNDPSNNCFELDAKGNFVNTKNYSNKTVDISEAGKVQGFGESSKGIFSWAASWWSSGKSDENDNRNHTDATDGTRIDSEKGSASVKIADCARGAQIGVEMFEKSYFWDILEEYLLTPHGSELVSEAKAREELAHGLQNGCWLLKGLDEKNIHQLVHLLISEKKWIKECSSETFHFQLTLPPRGKCAPFHSGTMEGTSPPITNGRPLEQCNSVRDRSTAISGKLSQLLAARNEKGQASYRDNENQGNNFDWEELGPISSVVEPHPGIDKVVRYQPPTPSDDEFSDDENHLSGQKAGKYLDAKFSVEENHTASQQAGQDLDAEFSDDENHLAKEQVGKYPDADFSEDENHTGSQQAGKYPSRSSLFEILASWNTSKDDGSRRRDHDINRLGGKPPRNTTVDCSRNDRGYRQCWRPTSKHTRDVKSEVVL